MGSNKCSLVQFRIFQDKTSGVFFFYMSLFISGQGLHEYRCKFIHTYMQLLESCSMLSTPKTIHLVEVRLFDLQFDSLHSTVGQWVSSEMEKGGGGNLVEIRNPLPDSRIKRILKKFSVCIRMQIQTENVFGILISTRLSGRGWGKRMSGSVLYGVSSEIGEKKVGGGVEVML